MEKIKFNPSNKRYYSEEFIKGFECGTERQFNADMAEKTAERIYKTSKSAKCSNCDSLVLNGDNYCAKCGYRMKGVGE